MQKTKKNRVLRLLSIVLMFTLVSTCLLGGTLARYVTEGSGTDTARVAKWGVGITSAASDLFKTSYVKTDASYTASANTVEATVDVVAPGTSGSAGGFSITGTPEVACRVTIAVDAANSGLENWTLGAGASGAKYEPVQWFLNGVLCGTNGTFAELVAELNTFSVDCVPGTDLSTFADLGCAISWEWPIDPASPNTDADDTFLGDKAAAPTIALKYAVKITQID